MLDKARPRGFYDELHQGELTAFLDAHPASFDLVISADTLCYFGDLGPMAAAASRALRPGGHLVFTVEKGPDDLPAGFRIEPHGRYVHAKRYLFDVLGGAGLTVKVVGHGDLRTELRSAVSGYVVVAHR
jgi:predicted TPR repeat methyltransferase